MSQVVDTDSLVLYIKRALGYPVVSVEIPDEHIEMCIDDAIGEIQPWFSSFRYLTTTVNTVIDLSEYNVLEVTDVFKVLPSNSSGYDDDPFSQQQMINSGSLSISSASYRVGSSHSVAANIATAERDALYNRLANTMKQKLSGEFKDYISYRFIDNKLYLDIGIPKSSLITIEYMPKVVNVEDFVSDDRFMRYLKDLSLAFTNIMLARILGKYQVNASPSTVNHDRMYDDGRSEVVRIREDLRTTVNAHFITD